MREPIGVEGGPRKRMQGIGGVLRGQGHGRQRRKAVRHSNGGATNSVDRLMTGDDKDGRTSLRTRSGRRNRSALRADRGSACRASTARCADKDTDNGDARLSDDGDVGATNSVDRLMTGDDKDGRTSLRTRSGRRNRSALRADRGSACRASTARCADKDTDNGDARLSDDGDVGATNSVDRLMTGDNKDGRTGPRTRSGRRNQAALRADRGSARRASAARPADENPDNDDARPSDDDDSGDQPARQSDGRRRAARHSQARTTAATWRGRSVGRGEDPDEQHNGRRRGRY